MKHLQLQYSYLRTVFDSLKQWRRGTRGPPVRELSALWSSHGVAARPRWISQGEGNKVIFARASIYYVIHRATIKTAMREMRIPFSTSPVWPHAVNTFTKAFIIIYPAVECKKLKSHQRFCVCPFPQNSHKSFGWLMPTAWHNQRPMSLTHSIDLWLIGRFGPCLEFRPGDVFVTWVRCVRVMPSSEIAADRCRSLDWTHGY